MYNGINSLREGVKMNERFNDYQSKTDFSKTVTIKSGEAISEAINLGGMTLVGFFMPSNWTNSKIELLSSYKIDGPYVDVYNDLGALTEMIVDTNRQVEIDPAKTVGIQFLKLESINDQGGLVNQNQDAEIRLVLRAF